MPTICSRNTLLTLSMRSCMARNCGMTRMTIVPIVSSNTGIDATRMSESGPSSRTARNKPTTMVMGAEINEVHNITTKV